MSNLYDAKIRTEEFWDQNPCGSGSTWARVKDLRFQVTDSYLLNFLKGPTLRGKNVIEIGCGQGFDASMIVERCKSYVGIDLSAKSLEIAQREVDQRKPDDVSVKFLQGDAEELIFQCTSLPVKPKKKSQ